MTFQNLWIWNVKIIVSEYMLDKGQVGSHVKWQKKQGKPSEMPQKMLETMPGQTKWQIECKIKCQIDCRATSQKQCQNKCHRESKHMWSKMPDGMSDTVANRARAYVNYLRGCRKKWKPMRRWGSHEVNLSNVYIWTHLLPFSLGMTLVPHCTCLT